MFIVVTVSIVCYYRRKQYQQIPGRDVSLSGVDFFTLTPSPPVTPPVPDPITPESLDDTQLPTIQVSSPIASRTRSKKKLNFEEEVTEV